MLEILVVYKNMCLWAVLAIFSAGFCPPDKLFPPKAMSLQTSDGSDADSECSMSPHTPCIKKRFNTSMTSSTQALSPQREFSSRIESWFSSQYGLSPQSKITQFSVEELNTVDFEALKGMLNIELSSADTALCGMPGMCFLIKRRAIEIFCKIARSRNNPSLKFVTKYANNFILRSSTAHGYLYNEAGCMATQKTSYGMTNFRPKNLSDLITLIACASAWLEIAGHINPTAKTKVERLLTKAAMGCAQPRIIF